MDFTILRNNYVWELQDSSLVLYTAKLNTVSLIREEIKVYNNTTNKLDAVLIDDYFGFFTIKNELNLIALKVKCKQIRSRRECAMIIKDSYYAIKYNWLLQIEGFFINHVKRGDFSIISSDYSHPISRINVENQEDAFIFFCLYLSQDSFQI